MTNCLLRRELSFINKNETSYLSLIPRLYYTLCVSCLSWNYIIYEFRINRVDFERFVDRDFSRGICEKDSFAWIVIDDLTNMPPFWKRVIISKSVQFSSPFFFCRKRMFCRQETRTCDLVVFSLDISAVWGLQRIII